MMTRTNMGDHFVLIVDRLLTESTLAAAIESRNQALQAATSALDDMKLVKSLSKKEFPDLSSPGKIVECRICQDEDEDCNMETPCACSGSLKYAHRRCVQRWCNEKGNTICEICHQQFKPGYTAPPPLFQFGRIPMHFRGNWEVSRRDSNNPRFIALVSTDRNFVEHDDDDDDDDEHSDATSRSILYCRAVAAIFMVLLILRHTLPILLNGANEYSFPLFMLLFLRIIGIILPIYVIVKAVTALHFRRQRQVIPDSSSTDESDEEETEHSNNGDGDEAV